MITLSAIRAAITQRLKTKYPDCKVYFDNVEKSNTPYFYVEITTSEHRTVDEVYTDRIVQVDITYIHPKDKWGRIDRSKVHEVGEAIDLLFRPVFQVGDRYITILDTEMSMVDDVLHYIFDMNFADAVTNEEAGYIRDETKGETLDLRLGEKEDE